MHQQVIDQRVIAVYFDKNRMVRRVANYGLKDGKIFDFISRTTPTGGQEISYLAPIFKLIRLRDCCPGNAPVALHRDQSALDKVVALLPAGVLLAALRIGVFARLVIEACELPLLERIAVVCCHDVAPFKYRKGSGPNPQRRKSVFGFLHAAEIFRGIAGRVVFKLSQCTQSNLSNKKARGTPRAFPSVSHCDQCARIASSNSATMLVILIIGFTAGPAVSL